MHNDSQPLPEVIPMSDPAAPPKAAKKTVEFTIDGEPFTTAEKTLTARELLVDYIRLDPATHYLIWVRGREQTSYEGDPDAVIEIHEKQVFITASLGPTPVS